MRILNLKELELVAGGNYDYPVLTDAEKATMTPEQIAEWDDYQHRQWLLAMYSGNEGDRMPDYDWINQHGNGTW